MGRVIDADVIIGIERGRLGVADLVTRAGGAIAISAVTASELLVGILRSNTEERRAAREAYVEAVMATVPVLPFDASVARDHARVSAALASIGLGIGDRDLTIAATALRHGHAILTRNDREFPRVRGLIVCQPDW